jgi:hypothetical protein
MNRDDIIRMALMGKQNLRDRISYAIALEREACAKVAETIEKDRFDAVGDPRISKFKSYTADAIRARGQG